MHKHLPYRISHVRLDRQLLNQPVLTTAGQGNYLVFWWKQIALGHLFLPPDQALTPKEYQQRLAKAIQPAVNLYAHHAQADAMEWQHWIADGEFERFIPWMDGVFSLWLTTQVPEKVPVSLLICTRDRPVHLKRCLEMIRSLTCRPGEIVVVDNAPSDTLTEDVVREFDGVRYLKEPRIGLDIARNSGVSAAKYPVVAFVDDDVVVNPMWLFRVWETFQDPRTAAMTGLVIALKLDTEAQYIFEKHWSFNRGYCDIWYDAQFFKSTLAKGPPVWVIGAGANMAFRKEVFEEVGFFNELLDVGAAGCNGDSEMWYRILAKGHTIHYNPRAVVYHEHRKEMKGLKKQIFYYMRGFTTAALLQQKQNQEAGYRRHIFRKLPVHYRRLVTSGFPLYQYRFKTVGVEILGILSGLLFYYLKTKDHPPKSLR